jgi:hypothetical protein
MKCINSRIYSAFLLKPLHCNPAAFRSFKNLDSFRSACVWPVSIRATLGADARCGKSGLILTNGNAVRKNDAVALSAPLVFAYSHSTRWARLGERCSTLECADKDGRSMTQKVGCWDAVLLFPLCLCAFQHDGKPKAMQSVRHGAITSQISWHASHSSI